MKRKLNVLVVDDEADVVEILSYNLRKEEHTVVKAYNGVEGVRVAKENKPDLIIMDIRMPEMSGIEACRQIRMIDELKNTPVLFLTADTDDYITMSAFEAGGNHFITKPIRPSLLVDMIDELIK